MGAGNYNIVNGYGGNDVIKLGGGEGTAVLLGGGDNTLTASSGYVGSIIAYRGNDEVTLGSGGAGSVSLGRGDDSLILGAGGAGSVELGQGNDTVVLSLLADKEGGAFLNGGGGTPEGGGTFADTVDFGKFSKSLAVDLGSTAAIDTGDGFFALANFENVMGGKGKDTLKGNGAANEIDGGAGADALTGGGGNDRFSFSSKLDSQINVDQVIDFNKSGNDIIALDGDIFTKLTGTGKLTAAQFESNSSGNAGDGQDRIVYETDTGELYYDSNGSAGGGSTLFAVLTKNLSLDASDFFAL